MTISAFTPAATALAAARLRRTEGVAGVGSFAGRLGAVLPQSGDYDPQLVGAQPASAVLDAYAAVNPTPAGLALLDDDDASAQIETLGTIDRATLPFRHYASRAAFEAAIVPSWVTAWTVVHDGTTLRYVKDATGTAITSANSVSGSPADIATIRHWGAVAASRSAAADNEDAINAAATWCRARGRTLHLGEGVFFFDDTLYLGGLTVIGDGTGAWSFAYAALGGRRLLTQARTQLVATGDDWTPVNIYGISSMKACGAARTMTARSGVDESEWRMLGLMNADATTGAATPIDLRVAVLIDNQAASYLSGFRVIPDGGGDDGLDDYDDATHADWVGTVDIGLLQLGGGETSVTDCQFVGTWRLYGALTLPIRRTNDYSDYLAPHGTTFERCGFEGLRAFGIRGTDRFKILASTSTTIDLPWADDHPFVTTSPYNTVRLTEGGAGTSGGAVYTYTGVSKVNVGGEDRIRLSGMTGVSVGSFYAVTPGTYGPGYSHCVLRDCQVGGVEIPSGIAVNDSTFPTPISNGAIGGIEVSGWRLAEFALYGVRIQHSGTVAIYSHDCREQIWDVMTEGASSNTTHASGHGLRYIVSPQTNANSHATHPAGESRWIEWRYAIAAEYTASTVDYRPFFADTPSPSAYSGDDGWFESYWNQRPATVRAYDTTQYLPVPKLVVGPGTESRTSNIQPDALIHARESSGDAEILAEAAASGGDAILGMETSSAKARIRVDQSDSDKVYFEVDADKNGSFTGMDGRFNSVLVDSKIDTLINLGLLKAVAIADDAVYTIDFGATVPCGCVIVAGNTSNSPKVLAAFRAASSPYVQQLAASGSPAYTTGALTGTTGADGVMTLSADTTGKLYIENRLGLSITAMLCVMQGTRNISLP